MGRLNTHVHVRDSAGVNHVFAPDSNVPAWAVEAITNPDVWEAGDTIVAPPRAGKGSGADAWRQHAEQLGITVPEDATRQDIIDMVEGA